MHVFTDGEGMLKNEFQTGYVLPIYFQMAPESIRKNMADHLNRLVKEEDFHLSTGFPATPFLLFALADNGYAETAYKLLLQDSCPSWLYEIKKGGTTLWEQWDAVEPSKEETLDKHCVSDREVSFNHYAYGAVGDFLYRRVVGIEPIEGGYKRFAVRAILGGNITSAEGSIQTPYGRVHTGWSKESDKFVLCLEVPVSTECEITLPNGEHHMVGSGNHEFICEWETKMAGI